MFGFLVRETLNSIIHRFLRPDRYAAGFGWYLREIVSTNELAGTRLDHVVEEDFADRVVGVAWVVIENSEESCVKLIVENRIGRLPDRAAEAGAVSDNLKTRDVELGAILRIKRRIVNYRGSRNTPV